MPAEYLTPKQVAELLSISPETLQNWRVKRQGPTFKKLGRGRTAKVLYTRQDVDAWVESMTRPTLGTTRRRK